ncbi:Glycosyltransferase, CAZy family GT8 [Fagus crenata]
MEIRLEELLRNACALDLVTCGGIHEVSEIAGMRSLCGLPGLKSLTITSCEWITELIVEGGLPEGGCLGKLKTIEVVDCRRLKTVISYALLCQVQNLEEIKTICSRESAWPVLERIHVSNCPMLGEIGICGWQASSRVPNTTFMAFTLKFLSRRVW